MEWLWSYGTYTLRIPEGRFWRMSLREFAHLLDRYKDEQEILDRRTARVCLMLYNTHKGPKDKMLTEDDFMPKPPPEPQTLEQQAHHLKSLANVAQTCFGGKGVNE